MKVFLVILYFFLNLVFDFCSAAFGVGVEALDRRGCGGDRCGLQGSGWGYTFQPFGHGFWGEGWGQGCATYHWEDCDTECCYRGRGFGWDC